MRSPIASGAMLFASFVIGLVAFPADSTADLVIDTDQTWTSPTSVTGDLVIRATLTIRNDVELLSPGGWILVEQGGRLVIDGSATGKVTIRGNVATGSRWLGIGFFPGSSGDIDRAHIHSVDGFAINSIGGPVIVRSTEISDVRSQRLSDAAAIRLENVTNFTIDRCVIHDVVAADAPNAVDAGPGADGPPGTNGNCAPLINRDGGSGGVGLKGTSGPAGEPGPDARGISVRASSGRITSSSFYNLRAGNGGNGANAGKGGNGGPGGNGIACTFGSVGDGGNGGPAGDGGKGNDGGKGGDAVGVLIEALPLNPNPAVIVEQCLFFDLAAGEGGNGGAGGAPGNGGAGGNGASSSVIFSIGGDAGNGGNAGQNGNGGAAGSGGSVAAVRTVTPIGSTDVNQCTISSIAKGGAGAPGPGGNVIAIGGAAGVRGTGASGNGAEGAAGNGSAGPGVGGAAGSIGFAVGVEVDQNSASQVPVTNVRNCIFGLEGSGPTAVHAFRTTNSLGKIEATRNLYDRSPVQLSIGTGIVVSMQLFGSAQFLDAPGGNFRVAPTSPAVDSGIEISGFLPLTDLAGLARRVEIPAVANTGSGLPPIDLGAFEVQVAACAGDFNGDGFVDDSDFSAFVFGYNLLLCDDPGMTVGCPADMNGDDAVDDADFLLFVDAYNALVCP